MATMATRKKAAKKKLGRPPSGEPWREHIAQTRLNDDEHSALEALARKLGKKPGTVLRDLIRRETGLPSEGDS